MTTYLNVQHRETVDGGYSGELAITISDGESATPMVFVDSDLLRARLVLTPRESIEFAAALVNSASKFLGSGR